MQASLDHFCRYGLAPSILHRSSLKYCHEPSLCFLHPESPFFCFSCRNTSDLLVASDFHCPSHKLCTALRTRQTSSRHRPPDRVYFSRGCELPSPRRFAVHRRSLLPRVASTSLSWLPQSRRRWHSSAYEPPQLDFASGSLVLAAVPLSAEDFATVWSRLSRLQPPSGPLCELNRRGASVETGHSRPCQ